MKTIKKKTIICSCDTVLSQTSQTNIQPAAGEKFGGFPFEKGMEAISE